jgi:hypothetical protein
VVSATVPYGRILGFLDRIINMFGEQTVLSVDILYLLQRGYHFESINKRA